MSDFLEFWLHIEPSLVVFLLWKHHPTQWGTVQFSSFSRSSGGRNQVQTESKGTIHNFWQYRQEIAVPKWICIIYPSSLLCYFMLLDLLLTQKVRSLAMSPMSSIRGQFVLWLTTVLFLFFFLPYHLAYGILVPQPGIEPMPPDLGAQSLNHWTTKEIPGSSSWRPRDLSGQDLSWGGESQVSSWELNFYLFHWPKLVEPCYPEYCASSSFRRRKRFRRNPSLST